MENQQTKLNRAVKIGIIIPAVFLAFFVLSGCSKKDAIQVDVTNNEQNQDSQAMEELKIKNEEQQKQLDILQKNQEMADCQKKKDDCANRIAPLQKKISSEIYGIGTRKKSNIPYAKEALNDCEKLKDMDCSDAEDLLKEEQKTLKEMEANLVVMQNQLAGLINNDCKDYQNPCE